MDTTGKQDDTVAKWAVQHDNERRARAIVINIVAVLAVGLIGVGCYFFWELRQSSRCASCTNDVFILREGLREYAAEHGGLVPPISPTRGNLMIDPEGFYPTYLDNACWLQCEWSDMRRTAGSEGKNEDLGLSGFTDDSFCYLPWEIRNEAEGLAFLEAYKSLNLNNRADNLTVHVGGAVRVLPRIRLSDATLVRELDDARYDIPVAVEWPDKFHRGGTVLYADGSIRTLNMGEAFPMTKDFIDGLHEIASMDKPLSKH